MSLPEKRSSVVPELRNLSAVFVGCARNCEPYLDGVLANLEALAGLYGRAAFIFVEDGSHDRTRGLLQQWLDARTDGHLIGGVGEASLEPRTVRLAEARNTYLDYVRNGAYGSFSHLVVLDLDDVNSGPIDPASFVAAASFLESDPGIVGVFANSAPVYFDVWALRHPDWCPNDCWAEVRTAGEMAYPQAVERYVHSRQICIPADTGPISVQSAFGGLGLYRLGAALTCQYSGMTPVNTEVCEHVSFNRKLAEQGQLFIFPALQNFAPQEHLRRTPMPESRMLRLEQNGRQVELVAPVDHRLDEFRNAFPLYDRRLPMLAGILSRHAPDESIVDIGANIGDTIALCRMAGCTSSVLAIEASEHFCQYLRSNAAALPDVFSNVRIVNAAVGRQGDSIVLERRAGTASSRAASETDAGATSVQAVSLESLTSGAMSLLKIDTDGYDAAILASNLEFITRSRPVIWAETEVQHASDLALWGEVLDGLAGSHPRLCVFDNFGFLVTHGSTRDSLPVVLSLLDYTLRHRSLPPSQVGTPRIHYLDVALFPERFDAAFDEFVSMLPEARLPS